MMNPLLIAFGLAALQSALWSTDLTSEVRMQDGVPALFVNGKLTSQILAAPYRPGESDFNDFRKAGISIFDIYLRFDWSGPDQYDFKRIDEKLDFYLKIEPKALFLPRILLTPGAWWCKEYPAEISMRDDGSPAGVFGGGFGASCHPSFASEKYRELSRKAMTAFLTHVEEMYGDHIVGYQPGNGFGGEWLAFNSFWEVRPGAPPPAKFGVEDAATAIPQPGRRAPPGVGRSEDYIRHGHSAG
jgi:hypothetical protein